MLRKLYIYLFFVGWLLSSCDSVNDLQPKQNLNEVIPQVTIDAIRQNYPDATKIRFSTIEKNRVFQSDFELKVDKLSAIVNHLGVISEMYKQTANISLPDNIKTYIQTNYSGATIINGFQQVDKNGGILGYKVIIKTKDNDNILLIFDATGTLTLVITDDKNNNPSVNGPPKTYFIDKSELPQPIIDYLDNKHNGHKFIKAAVVLDNATKNYSVVISQDLTTFDYLFDEKGNVLKSASFGVNAPADRVEDKPLNINDLPAVIKNYLDKEYKGWSFERGIYFSQNGTIQAYNLLISYDKKLYSFQFDAKGAFIRKEQIGNSNNPSNDKYDIKVLLPKDLPNVIINYLNAKHSNYKFIQTSLIIEKNKKTYWITILTGNTTYDYTFDEKGNFLTAKEIIMRLPDNHITQTPLVQKDVPSKVIDFLDKNFNGWIFQQAVIVFEDNKTLGFIIAIKVGNNYYYLSFDANANFIVARRG